MKLHVFRWGNSLALHVPAELANKLGLHEGATAEGRLTVDGALSIRPTPWNRATFCVELADSLGTMPMSAPATETVRRRASY